MPIIIFLMLCMYGTILPHDYGFLICLFDTHSAEKPVTQSAALTLNLIQAIQEKAAPILISPSLWHNFVVRRTRYQQMARGTMPSDDAMQDLFVVYGRGTPDVKAFKKRMLDLYQMHASLRRKLLNTIASPMPILPRIQLPFPALASQIRANLNNLFIADITIDPELKDFNPGSIRKDLDIDIQCAEVPFNKADWELYQVVDEHRVPQFLLLLPVDYVQQQVHNRSSRIPRGSKIPCYLYRQQGLIQDGYVTERELAVGLKVDHMPKLDNPFIPHLQASEIVDARVFMNVFVTLTDLELIAPGSRNIIKDEENRFALLPRWIIRVLGHGAIDQVKQVNLQIEELLRRRLQPNIALLQKQIDQGVLGGDIAGMYRQDFFKWLAFCNRMINTGCMFYDTCFGGGRHADFNWHERIEHLNTLRYSLPKVGRLGYVLINGALTDATTQSSYTPLSVPPQSDYPLRIGFNAGRITLALNEKQNPVYTGFFKAMMNYLQGNPAPKQKQSMVAPDYLSDAIRGLHEYEYNGKLAVIGNIPQIRFPHTQWFYVPELGNRVERITHAKVVAHVIEMQIAKKQNKPIRPFVIDNKQVLLVYPPLMPMDIRINGMMPIIVSMQPGDAYHHLQKLDASRIELVQILQSWTSISSLAFEKKFYIDELTCLMQNKMMTLRKVKFILNPDDMAGNLFEFYDGSQKIIGSLINNMMQLYPLNHRAAMILDMYKIAEGLMQTVEAKYVQVAEYIVGRAKLQQLVTMYESRKHASVDTGWVMSLKPEDRRLLERYDQTLVGKYHMDAAMTKMDITLKQDLIALRDVLRALFMRL